MIVLVLTSPPGRVVAIGASHDKLNCWITLIKSENSPAKLVAPDPTIQT